MKGSNRGLLLNIYCISAVDTARTPSPPPRGPRREHPSPSPHRWVSRTASLSWWPKVVVLQTRCMSWHAGRGCMRVCIHPTAGAGADILAFVRGLPC